MWIERFSLVRLLIVNGHALFSRTLSLDERWLLGRNILIELILTAAALAVASALVSALTFSLLMLFTPAFAFCMNILG